MISAATRKFLATAGAVVVLAACSGSLLRLAVQVAIPGPGSGAAYGRIDVDPLSGAVTLRDISLMISDGAVRIGTLTVPAGLGFTTSASAAENVTLQNVSIDVGGIYYKAARIDIGGSSFNKKELTELLDKNSKQSFVDRLAAFSADTIVIPEGGFERAVPGGKQTVTFTDLVLNKIVSGKAGTVAAAGGSIRGVQSDVQTFEAVKATNYDLVLTARLLSETAAASDQEPGLLYTAMTVDKFKIKGTNGSITAVNQVTSSNVKMQPGKQTRRLPPLLGTIDVTGVTLDIPSTKTAGEMQNWTLKHLVLSADELRGGLPTKFRVALEDLTMTLPPNSNEPAFKNLTELGYSTLTIGLSAEASWNPGTNEVVISRAALGSADMGTILVTGTLGKFTKDIFSIDDAVAREALMATTVKTTTLTMENKGLFEHALVRAAKRQGKSLDMMRADVGHASSAIVAAMLPGNSDNKSFASALSKFAVKPGKLNVVAKAKDTAGVPLTEFRNQDGVRPGISDRFDVNATAE